MNENLDIFVFSHKDFDVWPNNPVYKLVSLDKIETNIPWEQIICDVDKDPLLKMEHAYSEGARIHYLWKNYPLKEYVGTAHYRRYFDFFDNVPNMDEIFKEYDAICSDFDLGWPSIKENYKACHCEKDLNMCIDIIKEDFPEFYSSAIESIYGNNFIPCNIFVLRKETFFQWCEFVFGVLDRYNERMGFKTDLDVCNYVVNNMDIYCDKKGGINAQTFYQTRIHAFLMERLSTIFFHSKIKNPYYENIVLTEVHEDFEKTYFNQYEKKDISNINR